MSPRFRGTDLWDPFNFFDFFRGPNSDRSFKSRSLGSGVIVDTGGYILTNHHVVEKADKISVRLSDKTEYEAKTVGSDKDTDLAVIKIDVGHDLPVAKMGNSDAVNPGDWVLALGSPFGFEQTLTAGIISAKSRENVPGSTQFQSFLQTDAAINPGNSGGPLVNMAGEVIGINTAIISTTRSFAGIGFALPSNTAVKIYNQLISSGKVTRGSIGIEYVASPEPSLLRAFGLDAGEGILVQNVIPGGPAETAGLKAGDVITEIDGKKITGGSVLLDVVANTPVGQTIQTEVVREGQKVVIPITIGDRVEVIGGLAEDLGSSEDEAAETRLGIHVQAVTPSIARQLGLNSARGVIVSGVDSNSVAEEAGLQRGMVIVRFISSSERIDVNSVGDFRRVERSLRSGMDVALMVYVRNARSGEFRTVFVPMRIP